MAITATDAGFITGERSIDRTHEKYAVGGTDLGIMWDTGNGEVAVLFGDTWSVRDPEGGAGGEDWRHNVLGFSKTWPLDRGMVFDRFVTDVEGHAAQVIPDNEFPGFDTEVTTIPTGGCAVDGRQYVAYMSVREWGDPGEWVTNYAGLSYSDDGGSTWTKDENAWWANTEDGDQPFQVPALVPAGEHVYLVGTRNGRRGPAFVARAPRDRLLDLDAHEQWNGWGWGANPAEAVPVIDGEVSELSIQYHWPTRRWLACYTIDRERRIVVRAAPSVVGPWSPPVTVTDEGQFITLYGGFLHPWSMLGDELVIAVTQWSAYNVRLVRFPLSGAFPPGW